MHPGFRITALDCSDTNQVEIFCKRFFTPKSSIFEL